jgi:hypothetical protein
MLTAAVECIWRQRILNIMGGGKLKFKAVFPNTPAIFILFHFCTQTITALPHHRPAECFSHN